MFPMPKKDSMPKKRQKKVWRTSSYVAVGLALILSFGTRETTFGVWKEITPSWKDTAFVCLSDSVSSVFNHRYTKTHSNRTNTASNVVLSNRKRVYRARKMWSNRPGRLRGPKLMTTTENRRLPQLNRWRKKGILSFCEKNQFVKGGMKEAMAKRTSCSFNKWDGWNILVFGLVRR